MPVDIEDHAILFSRLQNYPTTKSVTEQEKPSKYPPDTAPNFLLLGLIEFLLWEKMRLLNDTLNFCSGKR
jgi:hypothetical protein